MKVLPALFLSVFAILLAAPVHALPAATPPFDRDIICSSGTYQPVIGELQLSRYGNTSIFVGVFIDNFGVRHPARLTATVSPAVLSFATSLGWFTFHINGAFDGDWANSTSTYAPAIFARAPAVTLTVKNHATTTKSWAVSFAQLQGTPSLFSLARPVSGSLTVIVDQDGNITWGSLALPIGVYDSMVSTPVYGGFVSPQRLSTVVHIKNRNFVLDGTSPNGDYNFTDSVAVYGNSKSSIYLRWSGTNSR